MSGDIRFENVNIKSWSYKWYSNMDICCTWMLSSKGSYYDKVGPIEGCYTKENRKGDNKGWLRRVENISGWFTLAENYWMMHTVLCLVCCFVHIWCLVLLCVLADEVLRLTLLPSHSLKSMWHMCVRFLSCFCVLRNDWLPILYEVLESKY